MTVDIHHGDCLDVMRRLADEGVQVDAVVTDPPYHLTSVSRNGSPRNNDPETPFGRTRLGGDRGFMGKTWDGGDIANRPETWALALALLKPGGHLVAFGGTRTAHRMVCAIEDAGFEIRDSLCWLYGTGFPKSLDVSKAIDKQRQEDREPVDAVRAWLNDRRIAAGFSHDAVNKHFGHASNGGGSSAAWTTNPSSRGLPKWDQWLELKALFGFGDEMDAEVWRLNGRKGLPSDAWLNAEVVGQHNGVPGGFGDHRFSVRDNAIRRASDAARQWEGWGTALKPAHEPICLARRPLAEPTVAAQVLATGTGAIHVDACRVPAEAGWQEWVQKTARPNSRGEEHVGSVMNRPAAPTVNTSPLGRWPANCLHDGSPEVLEAFEKFGESKKPNGRPNCAGKPYSDHRNIYNSGRDERTFMGGYLDTGTAARFFKSCEYSQDELLFWRAKAMLEEWNTEIARTADDSSALSRQAAVTALSDAVTSASRGALALESESFRAHFTSVTPSELRRISEAAITAILSIESASSRELRPERLSQSGSLVSAAAPNGLTGTITITISRWKSDGSAAPVTFACTPRNSALGARDLSGGSRFHYSAKASRADRAGSKHPTVKPVALMRWLCRLVCPPGGVILDPFAGSGTTGQAAREEGFDAILIEREAEYVEDIRRRLAEPLKPQLIGTLL